MELPEYRTLMNADYYQFQEDIKYLTEEGFIAVSANATPCYQKGMDYFYFALMVKNPVKKPNDFHYKILEALNELKFELKDIVDNLKYLRE